MTERDVFIESIPQIAEIIVEIRKMTLEQYEEFKYQYLETVRNTTPKALKFTEKVLKVVDTYLLGEGAA